MKRLTAILIVLFLSVRAYAVETIDPSEIRPGMTGYGLSVFRGWEPERFEVRVIDVVKNFFVQGDAILAELSGCGLEESGVIAGMSGSPVYIDGRLAGAVAYTWGFGKKPICGITPIGLMLSERDNAIPDFYDERGLVRRIAVPVSVSGMCPEAVRFLEAALSNQGLVFANGTGGGSVSEPPEGFHPGDAVAIKLIDGDIEMASTGTVTYVEGNDVLIFGHPLFQMGNVSFPVSRAYVYTVVPNISLSFKLGGASRTIGAALFDGRSAVFCRTGIQPYLIPVSVNVKTITTNGSFHFGVVNHKIYAAYLTAAAVSSSMMTLAGQWDEQSLRMKFRIDCSYAGSKFTITNEFRYVLTPLTYSMAQMLSDISAYVNAIVYNGFGDVSIDNIDVNAELTRDASFYTIVSAVMDRQTYYTGDKALITVVLKKYRSGFVTRTLTVPMPDAAISGAYKVYIGSEYELGVQLANLFPYLYRINNMSDLVRVANDPSKMTALKAMFVGFNEGIVYRRQPLANFPEPYISILNIHNDSGKNYAFPEVTGTDLELDAPLFGNQVISFTLNNRTPQEIENK